MISQILLRNFQVHRKFLVTLDRVTCFVGDSDSGKSAVVRALRFALLNRLNSNPEKYISWGAENLKVTVRIDDHTVQRLRGTAGNLYFIDNKEYRSFGNEVPEDIAKILNTSPINFQRQLDPQFWLTDSAGQFARNLNQIVNLDVIDSGMADAAARVRKVTSERSVVEDRIKEAMEKRKSLGWVVQADRELKEIERLKDRREILTSKIVSIASYRVKVADHKEHIERIGDAILAGKSALSLAARLARVRGEVKTLSEIRTGIAEYRRARAIEIPDIRPLTEFRKAADRVAEDRRNLEALADDIHNKRQEIDRWEKEIGSLKAELKRAAKERKVCPTCGQTIPSSDSFAPTSTSATKPRCSDHRNRTGTPR